RPPPAVKAYAGDIWPVPGGDTGLQAWKRSLCPAWRQFRTGFARSRDGWPCQTRGPGQPWESPCHGGFAMTLPSSLKAPGFVTRPYWWDAAEPPQRDNVLPAHSAVAIVGGGYAGLSAALTLRRLGHEVTVM